MRRVAFLPLVLVACSPGVAFQLDLADDDTVFVARLNRSGEVASTDIITPKNGVLALESEEQPTLLFVLEPDDVRGIVQGTSTRDWVFERHSDLSGCQRCILSGQSGPPVLYPGDRCPFPGSVEAFSLSQGESGSVFGAANPGDAERVQAATRFGPAGECPVDPEPRLNLPPEVEVTTELLSLAPWPAEVLATAVDGTVALFDQSIVRLLRPGQPTMEITDLPFVDQVRFAVPFAGGFAVLSRSTRKNESPDRPGRSRIHWFSMTGEYVELMMGDAVRAIIEMGSMAELPASLAAVPGNFVLGVAGKGQTNAFSFIVACDVTPDHVVATCRELSNGTTMFGSINSLSTTTGGQIFFTRSVLQSRAEPTLVVGVSDQNKRVEWTESAIPDAEPTNQNMDLASAAETVFVCGLAATEDGAVWAADASQRPLTWSRLELPQVAAPCRFEPGGSDLKVVFDAGRAFMIDPTTRTVSPYREMENRLGERRLRSLTRAGHQTVVRDDCDTFYFAHTSSVSEFHGDAQNGRACVTALAETSDGQTFGFGLGRVAVNEGGNWLDEPYPTSDLVRRPVAAVQRSDGSFLVGLKDRPGLVRLDSTTSTPIGDLPGISRIVDVGNATFVLAEATLYRVRSDALETVPTHCGIYSIDGRDGVLYAGGVTCVDRVIVFGEELIIDQIFSQNVNVSAIGMVGLDHVLLSTGDEEIVELSPGGAGFEFKAVGRAVGSAQLLTGSGSRWLRVLLDLNWSYDDCGALTVVGSNARKSLAGLSNIIQTGSSSLSVAQGRLVRVSIHVK